MLLGLKLEDGVAFMLDKKTRDWVLAPTSALPDMEALLKRMELFDYPDKTTRENIILENEFDIGTGRVKSFQDEDGDLTVMFQHQPRNSIQIDEDAAFGLGAPSGEIRAAAGRASSRLRPRAGIQAPSVAGNGTRNSSIMHGPDAKEGLSGEINTTAALKNLEISGYAEMQPKRRKNARLEEAARAAAALSSAGPTSSPGSPKKRAARKTVPLSSTDQAVCVFKKRPPSSCTGAGGPLKSEIRALFLKTEPYSGKGITQAGAKKRPKPRVSFMSTKLRLVGSAEDAGFLISMIRFNKMNKVKGVFEENFYLERLREDVRHAGECKRYVTLEL